MEKSIFEKIADRELPGHFIWEDQNFMAFLSIGPLYTGHTLVVPKKNPGDYIFGMDDQEYSELWLAAKHVAGILKSKLECDRVLVWVEGFEVPHVHIHLVPVKKGQGILKSEVTHPSKEQLAEICAKINR